MELLEYQAKNLFRQAGIPVLPAQIIHQTQDLKNLTLPYPIVLKSQVRAGGRGKAGGIRHVSSTIDAISAAYTIFNLSILGEYPKLLLAEAAYKAERELYLAIVLHPGERRPVLLGSALGGAAIEDERESIQQVIVDRDFSLYYARRLVLKMGLEGDLVDRVSDIVERMYRLFVDLDLDLLEINPLAIGADGEVMALDGKVSAAAYALDRHPQIKELLAVQPASRSAGIVKLEGNIGILSSGLGLTLSTVDLVKQAGGLAGAFVSLPDVVVWPEGEVEEGHSNGQGAQGGGPTGGGSTGGHANGRSSGDLSDYGSEFSSGEDLRSRPVGGLSHQQERLLHGLVSLSRVREIKVIVVNLLGLSMSCSDIATTIASYLQRSFLARPQMPLIPIVVRLDGPDASVGRELLSAAGITSSDSLEDAIAHGIQLARMGRRVSIQ
jgi:succinyl-CoA synthetase beta subunit